MNDKLQKRNLVLATCLAGLLFISVSNSCISQSPSTKNIKPQPSASNTNFDNVTKPTDIPVLSSPSEKPVPTTSVDTSSSPTVGTVQVNVNTNQPVPITAP